MNKILSLCMDAEHSFIYFLGIKIRISSLMRFLKSFKEKSIQNKFLGLKKLEQAKNLVVFLIPGEEGVSGGILSIYSLCSYTRKCYPKALSLIATFPARATFSHNDCFQNDEDVYRWSQLVKKAKNVENLIIHIPEYLSGKFYRSLSFFDIRFLKSIKDLQINILNQNMEIMPSLEKVSDLFKLTQNVTQTLAFVKNLTQDLADRYQMPVHLFSTWLDYSKYAPTAFDKKEKIIVLSPDQNEHRSKIVRTLETQLPNFSLVTVKHMKFEEYMALISKAFAVITFGEGFDGYFSQPSFLGTLSFSVFNETFFPDKSWLSLKNVFGSYQEMNKNISDFILRTQENQSEYYQCVDDVRCGVERYYSEQLYEDNLKRFYLKQYDVLPRKEVL